ARPTTGPRRPGRRLWLRQSAADHAAIAGARPGPLQHLLRALPQPCRRWRRHDRAARLPRAAQLPHGTPARGAGQPFLPGHHQRLRRDVSVCRPRRAARPLGHRRLHPRAAAQPTRAGRRAYPTRPRLARGRPAMNMTWPRRREWIALGVGVVGLAGCLLLGLDAPRQALLSFLFAFVYFTGLAVGSLALAMVHPLTGGAWGYFIRPQVLAAA